MFIDSERFIKLQNIYQDKAGQDVEMIQKKFLQALESFGRSFETISEWQEVLQRNKIPEDPERIQRESVLSGGQSCGPLHDSVWK